ncbi:hypothetical protein EAH_00036840 [Eimeria acervulina]|uniref:Uncharacterized protein n=1 Tax=Eimeria acervulina TaxID=5801 RepID=U6GUW9_EIMAC|nr:hypothetical protein EAH_00036840 [Eimeria acervulina]CDI83372.1 hypothetical protein EAH_00036840 [Eimeria acervulina]
MSEELLNFLCLTEQDKTSMSRLGRLWTLVEPDELGMLSVWFVDGTIESHQMDSEGKLAKGFGLLSATFHGPCSPGWRAAAAAAATAAAAAAATTTFYLLLRTEA